MLEGQVNDAVGGRRCGAKAVEVVQVAAVSLGARGLQGGGLAIGAGQADHLMAVAEQLGYERGADVTGSPGDEYTHGMPPCSDDSN